jgi:hypothetical protein
VTPEQPPAASKEPYQKPELVVIELKAEEVLAVGCKTTARRGVGPWLACGRLQGCNRQGS